MNSAEHDDPRVRELQRRIEILEAQDEAEFGQFTSWDWTLCTVCCVALPLLLIWRCA
jgi:hypothetical protein